MNRTTLAERVLGEPEALKRLEELIHPAVARERESFLADNLDAPLVVLDIPLLFEKGGFNEVDKIVVVSAPADVQRTRVLGRPGMTVDKFERILALQMPDSEKRCRAHFVVDSSRGFDSARAQVHGILRAVALIPGRRWGQIADRAAQQAG